MTKCGGLMDGLREEMTFLAFVSFADKRVSANPS